MTRIERISADLIRVHPRHLRSIAKVDRTRMALCARCAVERISADLIRVHPPNPRYPRSISRHYPIRPN